MTKHHNILVIDDDPDFVELVKRALTKSNIANPILSFDDGIDALSYVFCSGEWEGRDPEDTPAVILLDLKLPKMDGLEVLRRLRADLRTKPVPVVVFSASSEEEDIDKAYSAGCNSYIRKPLDLGKLTEALQQAGVYWLMLNEPRKGPV